MPRIGSQQLANTVLMIAPSEFGYNEETADDNIFQEEATELTPAEIRDRALAEFHRAVEEIRKAGVRVLALETPAVVPLRTPDAVFPNNWISTTQQGNVVIYPMRTKNRRCEADRLSQVLELFEKDSLVVRSVIDLRKEHPGFEATKENGYGRGILEGTGSVVIDHLQGHLFVSLSERAHSRELSHFVKVMAKEEKWNPKCVEFNTRSAGENGKPYYHTNVVMSIGEAFAVVCLESIENLVERELVVSTLQATGREIFEVDRNQAEKYFCANILQLKAWDEKETRVIVMSKRAKEGFETKGQLEALSRHGKIVAVELDMIESIGGGSARCMLGEVFLPRRA